MLFCKVEKIENNQNKGFSLMELIIATGIIAAVFVAMMSLFMYNLQMEILNRNKIIASYLAQEAVEIIRQKRDSNWFSSATWDTGIILGNDLILSAKDVNDLTLGWDIEHGGAAQQKQKIYLCSGKYVQSKNGNTCGGTDIGFRRILTITESVPNPPAVPPSMTVTVDIIYNVSRHVNVTTYLYNDWL